jgi:formate dehydrogenase maturation protein FdhE
MGKVAKTADRAKAADEQAQACPKCGKPVRIVKRVRNRELGIGGGMYLSCSVCEFAEKL